MLVLANIWDWICTFNEAFWLFYLADYLLRNHYQRREKKEIWCRLGIPILCYMVIVIGLNQIELTSEYTAVTAMLFSIIYLLVVWKYELINAIAIVGIYFLIMVMENFADLSVIGFVGGDTAIYQVCYEQGIPRIIDLSLYLVIWPLICMGIRYCWKQIKQKVSGLKYIALASLTGFVGFLFLYYQIIHEFQIHVDIVAGIFTVISIVFCFSMYCVEKIKNIEKDLQLVEAQNTLQKRAYDQLDITYTSREKAYHDMNKHLHTIQYLLEQGEPETVKTYVNSLIGEHDNVSVQVRTGIRIVDMILSDKEQMADKQKTQIVMVTQHLSKNTSIEQKDICALLSNLLDNAIEAKPKRIDVIIKQVQGMLMVQVRNDIVEKPRKENGRFLTRKSNQIEHGWGLRSVEAVVEKYFGSIEYLVDDKSFSVNILMNY